MFRTLPHNKAMGGLAKESMIQVNFPLRFLVQVLFKDGKMSHLRTQSIPIILKPDYQGSDRN